MYDEKNSSVLACTTHFTLGGEYTMHMGHICSALLCRLTFSSIASGCWLYSWHVRVARTVSYDSNTQLTELRAWHIWFSLNVSVLCIITSACLARTSVSADGSLSAVRIKMRCTSLFKQQEIFRTICKRPHINVNIIDVALHIMALLLACTKQEVMTAQEPPWLWFTLPELGFPMTMDEYQRPIHPEVEDYMRRYVTEK